MPQFTYHVAILTAPRPTPTLEGSLRSIERAGWSNPLIFLDRFSVGCYWNFRQAMSSLVAAAGKHNPNARILIFEDDIEVAANLRRWLDCNGPLSHSLGGVVSLYTAAPNHSPLGGWHAVEKLPKHAMGALATLWPIAAARLFMASPPHPEWRDRTDHAIGLFCRDNGIPLWVHSPSFVKHAPAAVGHENSALRERAGGTEENRQCLEFCEDAASLVQA